MYLRYQGLQGMSLNKLTEKAKEMGAKTKFSAKEAAECVPVHGNGWLED